MAITDRLKDELLKGFQERERQAVVDARLLAENSGRISQALRDIDPKLETAVLALAEFVKFQESIRDNIQAIAGHATEESDLARSHALDMAHVATVGINLPEIMEAQPLGLEEIPAGATEGDVEQAIYRLAFKIRKAHQDNAGAGVLRIGLVLESGE